MDQMVAGVAPATMEAAAGGGARLGALDRGGLRGRGGPGGQDAHPERIGVAGRGRGGRTATRRCPDGGGPSGGETGRRRRFRPPSVDSFGVEVERVEAETTACSMELVAVGGVGGRDGSGGGQEQEEPRQGREMAAAQGEERSLGFGVLLLSTCGRGARRRPEAARPRRHGRSSGSPVATGKKMFCENPLAQFPLFAKRSSSMFRDLNKAPGHFHKMCKNSYGLQLSSRGSTKIGVAK